MLYSESNGAGHGRDRFPNFPFALDNMRKMIFLCDLQYLISHFEGVFDINDKRTHLIPLKPQSGRFN